MAARVFVAVFSHVNFLANSWSFSGVMGGAVMAVCILDLSSVLLVGLKSRA